MGMRKAAEADLRLTYSSFSDWRSKSRQNLELRLESCRVCMGSAFEVFPDKRYI